MKLSHCRLAEGIQAAPGRLGTHGPIEAKDGYRMVLIANLRAIKIDKDGWHEPVYIPVEKFDCFSPLIEDPTKP